MPETSVNQSHGEKEKEAERALLLRKVFDGLTILAIGRELNDAYCMQFTETGYDKNFRYYDEKTVANRVSRAIVNEGQLLAFSHKYKDKLKSYWNFFGKFYTYYAEKKKLQLESSWPIFQEKLNNLFAKHGAATYAVLKAYIELRQDYDAWSACDYNRLEYRAKELAGKGWKRALIALEIEGIVEKRGSGRRPGERSIALELIPLVEQMLSGWTMATEKDLITRTEKKPTKRQEREELWDLFICHASEDKDEVARPLADVLRAKGLKVWYDDFTLTLGDSLRRSIDFGLARSRYGIVILSPNFFKKDWPQRELDGLTARERKGVKVILPVWHNVDRGYVLRYSPTLADKLAVSTDEGLDKVVDEVLKAVGRDKFLKEFPEEIEKEPHFILDELENATRKCIKSNLEKLSESWWVERVPPDIRQKAEERQKKDELKRELIQYLDFADYAKIITRRDNWREVFQKVFREQEVITAKLRELEPIRNAVRHGRKLTTEQREKLKIFSRDIIGQTLASEI